MNWEALGAIGDPTALGPLIETARHAYSEVARSAMKALTRFDDGRAFSALVQLSRDEKWSRRCAAMRALGESDNPEAIAILQAGLEDYHDQVRKAAADALHLRGIQTELPANS